MRTVTVEGHTISVDPIGLKSKIMYDGAIVSTPGGIAGANGVFHVEENGERVQYDVEMNSKLFSVRVVIRRNGRIVYSD